MPGHSAIHAHTHPRCISVVHHHPRVIPTRRVIGYSTLVAMADKRLIVALLRLHVVFDTRLWTATTSCYSIFKLL
jgi:hypothetical protein